MVMDMQRPIYTPQIEPVDDIPWDDPIITPPRVQLPDHPLTEKIVQAIRHVYDPEIPVNIYELGLIYRFEVNDQNDVDITMTLTAPGCPVAGEMPGWVRDAIFNRVPEVGGVEVNLVWEPKWSPACMAENARLELDMDLSTMNFPVY